MNAEKLNADCAKALAKTVAELAPAAAAGDENAIVEHAMGKALLSYTEKGGWLTDLPWFSESSYYTGNRLNQKAA
jgi:hypothetical protein